MALSNPVDILIAHDRWATRNILVACGKLTPEQFHQRFDMGPGSLHDTTTHILGAMARWTDVLEGRAMGARLEEVTRTAPELLTVLEQVAGDFERVVRAHPLDEVVTRTRDGKTYSFTRGGVLTHVATHGMHHRAQCLNMLRHVGVSPLPASSVTEWMVAVDRVP
jgi:uncharacterized damage-inducible protein DinB